MNAINNIDLVVERMIELLLLGGGSDGAAALEQIRRRFDKNIVDMSYGFLSLYGGGGALNDVVLYRDGKVLVAENGEFDLLRSKLYEICKELNRY